MPKAFLNPAWTANRILTNLMADFHYEFDDWNEEAKSIELAVIETRLLEEQEMYIPLKGFAVDVWTGLARPMSIEEQEQYKLSKLVDRLSKIDKERKELRRRIRDMTEQPPDTKKQRPFNLKDYQNKRKRKDKPRDDKGEKEGEQ